MTLQVSINSFSYKKGLPLDNSSHGGGYVFDCRALPNPGREEKFKNKTGLDSGVIDYLVKAPEAAQFLKHVEALVVLSIDNYLVRGFSYLSVSFGCTGGQHRSVYFSELLAKALREKYGAIVEVIINHRDMPRFS